MRRARSLEIELRNLPRPLYRVSICAVCCLNMSEGTGIDKPLLAFLNGISKRVYFAESDITDDFLREEVLGGMAEDGAL